MQLPAALADKLDDFAERGNVLLEDQRDWRDAIAQWRQALMPLPEPRVTVGGLDVA